MRCVDLFAGWGGFTAGAEAAGCRVVWAANHWRLAVETHALNHPKTRHECQDLRQADWGTLPRYDLLLASPACQGHSTASQPKRRKYHDALRATAWAVVDCADATSPRALIVENVPSFRQWRLYPVWREALRLLGYHLTEHILTASHHGTPQRRSRLFVVGTRRPVELELATRPEPAYGPCIDWKAPGWRPWREAAPGAQRRIRAAQKRHGRRFLTQHVSNHPGVPLDQPIRTITTKDQWGIVDGDRYRPLTLREYARGMGFADSYQWPADLSRADAVKGLGNAVCPPVAEALITRVADAL
jgi:DNA (cytosine-5)-methyltransferase 1